MDDYGDSVEFIDDESIINSTSVTELVQRNISSNLRELNSLLSKYVAERGDTESNIVNVMAKRTYKLPTAEVEKFFTLLDNCRKEALELHFSERQENSIYKHSGIMIDFDYYQSTSTPQITTGHIDDLVRHFCRILKDTLDFSEHYVRGRYVFRVFVIKKPEIKLTTKMLTERNVANSAASGTMPVPLYKDGFHILVPEIQICKGVKRYLLDQLISRGIIKDVFEDIPHINGPESMLDTMSASNPVHFFGCSKVDSVPYLLTDVYEITFFGDMCESRKLNADDILGGPYNLTYELSLSFYLESIGGKKTWLCKRKFEHKAELASKINVELPPAEVKFDEDLSVVRLNNPSAKYIHDLLNILDISYATDYNKWFRVICAVAHTGASEDYKAIARDFSKRNPAAWNPREFERVWNEALKFRHDRRPVTIGSLRYWARQSSPHAYAEIEKTYYAEMLLGFAFKYEGRIEHAHVASICHLMCGDKFVVDRGFDEANGRYRYIWFEFVTPGQSMKKGEVYKWRPEDKPVNLHLFISDRMSNIYDQVYAELESRFNKSQNANYSKLLSTTMKNIKIYKARLSNDGFQNGVISQCVYKFLCRGFCDELDSYEDIIGVGNGVLRLGVEPQLIQGHHEYRISKYTDVDYIPYDPENPYVKTLLQAFRDIFPEKDVFEFAMFHAATGLDARESACILWILVGGGQNGKTFYLKMIHNTLGPMYSASGKPSLLTAPVERGESANSAQMQQKGKRYFYMDEFNSSCTLNDARIKMMTTPGWQSGRDLYQRQVNFKNTANPVAASNFEFHVDTTDHGTWRRIYRYSMKVKFCKDPNPNNPYEKKANDKYLTEYTNDINYRRAMLSIMVHYYSRLMREYDGDLKNIPVPTIWRETEEFRNRCDCMNRFITQMLVKSNSSTLSMSDLVMGYSQWYRLNIKEVRLSPIDIQSQFENSRIAKYLERRAGGALVLPGFRIRGYAGEPLQDGEVELIQFEQNLTTAGTGRTNPSTSSSTAVVDSDDDL